MCDTHDGRQASKERVRMTILGEFRAKIGDEN